MAKSTLLETENKYKKSIFSFFDSELDYVGQKFVQKEKVLESGSYEDQDAFVEHAEKFKAETEWHKTKWFITALYDKPYFSHIEAEIGKNGDLWHCFLSDNEALDGTKAVGSNLYLVPFKKDPERPMLTALFHCYQAHDGEKCQYRTKNGIVTINPRFICKDEFDRGELIQVNQIYPESELIDADELLEKLLEENRYSPNLKNIISTLQQKQFEIIAIDSDRNFVVQGCAGSGKSQCLLHRLFYLRDELSQDGWEKVMLITPTQLFRNYSSPLMKRYQLNDINNCSIAEFYQNILAIYDPKFKARHYQYELSEEYLPDQYLSEAYNQELIRKIDDEIESAISRYIMAGCDALGIQMPENPDEAFVSDLCAKLEVAMKQYDDRETKLREEKEYAKKREEYEKEKRNYENLEKQAERVVQEIEKIEQKELAIKAAQSELADACEERDKWEQQQKERVIAEKKELKQLEKQLGRDSLPMDVPAKYAKQLFVVRNLASEKTRTSNDENIKFISEYCLQIEKDLNELTNNQDAEKALDKLQKKKEECQKKADLLSDEIEKMNAVVDEYAEWIRTKAAEVNEENANITIHRAEMEKALYYLQRIESSIFEKEVWNVLSPIKQKYGIKVVNIEQISDEHKKETRILYKSDLLFYIKIYMKLHRTVNLPQYNLFCIDEAQDLHKVDYDVIKMLYPKAVYNVFGDTSQTLHIECGIQDWKEETGIETVFPLSRNYRNSASVVRFCNEKFHTEMEYIGKPGINTNQYVVDKISFRRALNSETTLIVKNRSLFIKMCNEMSVREDLFEFIDTHTDNVKGGKIPCYTIFAAKGLEFTSVAVFSKEMNTNQKVVACTRAMERLYYYE